MNCGSNFRKKSKDIPKVELHKEIPDEIRKSQNWSEKPTWSYYGKKIFGKTLEYISKGSQGIIPGGPPEMIFVAILEAITKVSPPKFLKELKNELSKKKKN